MNISLYYKINRGNSSGRQVKKTCCAVKKKIRIIEVYALLVENIRSAELVRSLSPPLTSEYVHNYNNIWKSISRIILRTVWGSH